MESNQAFQTVSHNKLPNWLTTVTPFSKLLAMILLILLPFAGFYLGMKYQEKVTVNTPIVAEIKDTPISTASSNTNLLRTYTSIQIPGNSLKPYTIQFPTSWIDKDKRVAGLMDTFTLTRDNYIITIFQTESGGAGCIFEGDIPNGPYGDYRNKQYTEISSGVGILRRFENTPPGQNNSVRFDFCAKSGNMFQMPSKVGAITYTVPVNYNKTVLKEMDTIVSSLNVAP